MQPRQPLQLLRVWWGEVLPAGVQDCRGWPTERAPVLTGAVAAMADESFDYIGLAVQRHGRQYAGNREMNLIRQWSLSHARQRCMVMCIRQRPAHCRTGERR